MTDGPGEHNARTGPNPKVLWWPLVFTLFIGFIFLDPLQRHASRLEWTLTAMAVAAFLGLYTYGLAAASRRQRIGALVAIAAITLLGFVFAPFNGGAALFIIFSTSTVPYAVEGEIGSSAGIIGIIVAAVGVESWLLHLNWPFWVYSFLYAVVLGTGNTYAARQAFSVERIAKADERERIARDLHDVLGHTLSLIVLKAELAGKLIDRDVERARAEIADVEQISRSALAEVRQTIGGYLSGGLHAELERAKATLETAGVATHLQVANIAMTPVLERVMVLVLREAVTNVLRHAHAKTCRLWLQNVDGRCRLEIRDDGRGGSHVEGHGMRGMRDRIEALGGTFVRDAGAGTRLTIEVPLEAHAEGQAR